MPLLTEDRLSDIIDLPIALPNTTISPGNWVLIGSVNLVAPAKLEFRYLQLQVMEIIAPAPATGTCAAQLATINTSFLAGSLAAVFLVQNFVPDTAPNLQPYLEILTAPTDFNAAPAATAPILVARDSANVNTLTAAGIYSLVVLNNTTDRDISLSVNGAITIDLAPTA